MSSSIPTSTLEKFTTFGDLLRYLRRAAGLTQLELSVQVGYSHAQISRLEQNLRLPDIPTIEARFIPALDLQNEPRVIARLLELAANVRREDAPGLGLCPYKGLNYFDESDADLFVGREALTAKLTDRVLSLMLSRSASETRFLTVVGASGSGKSSLVRAGLVPALRWNKNSADWQIQILTPTAHPLESLAASLTSESESVTATSSMMDDLAQDPRSLQIFVKRQLKDQTRLLLVIDQFEELFALCRSEEERASFIGNLLTAASEADGPVIVLITLRADFYAHCANYIQLREALAHDQEYIGAMSDEELQRAIEEPARRGRWELESGLMEMLLHDVGHEPGALPLLSHALFETWQKRRGRTMTMSGYVSSGGVRGAIAETAETVFTDHFTSEQRIIARRIFLRLTELGDESSTSDTRRRTTFKELILKPEEATSTYTILKMLADARLIITSEDSAEVAHEALIREWPTLRGWLEDNRAGLLLHRQLTESAQEWLAAERSSDMLYRGARLAQAREWASTLQEEMNELEYEFLNASVDFNENEAQARETQRQRELETAQKLAEAEKQRAKEQEQTASQLRKRAIYLAGAFTIALVMALTAAFFNRQAQISSRLATSRELAAASIINLDVDPERSILLGLEALDTAYTIEAEDALHRAIQSSHIQRVMQVHQPGAPMMVALSLDEKQFVTATIDGTVKLWDALTGESLLRTEGRFAAYSPDGRQLAVVIPNGTVKMIDLATGKEILFPGQIDASFSIAFSPDGARLATIASNNAPKIWDTKTGKELIAFPGHTDFISTAVFNPAGTRLLTASDDGTARVWDAGTGEQLLTLSSQSGWVMSARYSPDGTLIATISGNDAFLWDAETGEKSLMLTGHKNRLYAIAFSPDGALLATGSLDRKTKVWDVATGKELFTLSGHMGGIYDIAFSRDGKRLISSSDDGTVRIWDISPSHELLTLSMDDSTGQIAFSPDGHRLATSDDTGAIKMLDAHSGEILITLPVSRGEVRDLALSPDGARIFAALDDRTLKVWDAGGRMDLAAISSHTSNLNGIAVSKDGKQLAAASDDYKALVWDLSSGKTSDAPVLSLKHSGVVFSVAFSTDGTWLATGVQDGTIRIWDARNGKEVRVLGGHADFVTAVVFRPDGTHIASSSSDGTAKVWNASTGAEEFTLSSHTDVITSISYNPDGTRIATASSDGTAKLWDASSGEELLTFFGDGSPLNDIAFSSDGTRLATGGVSGVRIYLLHIDDLIALAKTRVTRSFTVEECQKYLHLDQNACAPAAVMATSTPFPPSENGRVCQVTNKGGLYDKSFNEMIFKGLQDSTRQFQWDAKVLQSASASDFEKNIRELLRGDCDLIIGIVPMMNAIRSAAETNPNQKFMFTDFVYDPAMNNVWSQTFAVDQAAFLAGYLAASATKTGKVGTFGGIDITSVTDFMDGFALGVAYYNEQNDTWVEVLGWNAEEHQGLFIGDFCCAAEGRKITQELLDHGADIIVPAAGTAAGAGALYAVKTYGNAFIIGVDTDWAVTHPEYADIILTSITKNYDVSVVQAVNAIVNDTFSGGEHIGTLETGEVGLAPFYKFDALVSDKVKSESEQIRKEIIAGKIKTKP